jgi:hypothetical protein
VYETPSDDRLLGLHPNAQLTLPALKVQTLALLGSPLMATGSSCEPLGLQTATDKEKKETRQLANKNKDVTEWLLPAAENQLICSSSVQGLLGSKQEVAFKLGAHCPATGAMGKPKSPSNLSEERDAESDSPEALEAASVADEH